MTLGAVINELQNSICYKSFHLFHYIFHPHALPADYDNSQIT